MTRVLALDIETIPQEKYLEGGSFTASDEWWERVRSQPMSALEQTAALKEGRIPLQATGVAPALHPTTAHIVAVNLGWWENQQPQTKVLRWDPDTPEGEHLLLTRTLEYLDGAARKGTTLVTFNGKAFDLPMTRWRVALLGVEGGSAIPWRKWLYPWSEQDHCDLRLLLGNGNRFAHGTQQWWAEAFGLQSEERGHEVLQMVQEGRWADLEAYGASEARTLLDLYGCVVNVL